jgi:hypothetical protein
MALTRQCCVCLRIHIPSPAAPNEPEAWAPTGARVPGATHTYCPECYRAALREVRSLARRRGVLQQLL